MKDTTSEDTMRGRVIQLAIFLGMVWGVMIGIVCGLLFCLMRHKP